MSQGFLRRWWRTHRHSRCSNWTKAHTSTGPQAYTQHNSARTSPMAGSFIRSTPRRSRFSLTRLFFLMPTWASGRYSAKRILSRFLRFSLSWATDKSSWNQTYKKYICFNRSRSTRGNILNNKGDLLTDLWPRHSKWCPKTEKCTHTRV